MGQNCPSHSSTESKPVSKSMTDTQFKQRQQIAKRFRLSLIKKATKPELVLKDKLTKMNIHFLFQKVFIKEKGMVIVDFYFPKRKLIIEVDGISHFNKVNYKDIEKNEYLTLNRGFSVIRITNTEAKNITQEDLYSLITSAGIRQVVYSPGYHNSCNRKC